MSIAHATHPQRGQPRNKKSNFMSDESLDDDTKAELVNSLELDGCCVEDLCLTFQYSPSSAAYEYEVTSAKAVNEVIYVFVRLHLFFAF